MTSVDPEGEVGFCGEDGSKDVQEDEGGAADTSEGNQKLSTQYKELEEAIQPHYVLISVREEVGADKNVGEKGSAKFGGGCDRVRIRPPHCVTVTPVHGFFIVYL